MSIKDKDKIRNFNIDTLKLLIADEDAQNKIKDMRSAAKGMPTGGFQGEKEFLNWYRPILKKYVDGNKEAVEIMKTLYGGINEIINTYGLTKDFFPPLWSYICFNEFKLRIEGNFEISMTYPEKNEPLVISIEIPRKPTTKELKEIQEIIKEWSSRHLPAHRKIKTVPKADIDTDLKIFSMMKSKGIRKEKIYDSQYLETMKSKYDKGSITKKGLLEAERLNKNSIKIRKSRVTSKTIGKKIFGTTQAHQKVRAINKRIKNEISRRFKKV